MSAIANAISRHFDVPLDARDLALSLPVAALCLVALWAVLAAIVVSVPA